MTEAKPFDATQFEAPASEADPDNEGKKVDVDRTVYVRCDDDTVAQLEPGDGVPEDAVEADVRRLVDAGALVKGSRRRSSGGAPSGSDSGTSES